MTTTTSPRPARRFLQPAVVVALLVTVIGAPFWLVLATASKTQGEALNPNLAFPPHWRLWENIAQASDKGEIGRALLGSTVVVIPAVIGVLVFGSMAAWIFGRRSGRGTSVLYGIGISGVLLPPAVVTVVLVLRQLHLAGTQVGMIGVYMGMYLSTVIFFITGFVRTIPIELEEAARVDGAGPVRVFFTMILPLLRPVIATCTILITLFAWNDVFYAFFVLGGGKNTTMPLNLFKVASTALYTNAWNLIFSYVILTSLPLVVLFSVAQRKIISGITSGAVK
jgi:raffinose/stachyose/melibiose transport system permease protein